MKRLRAVLLVAAAVSLLGMLLGRSLGRDPRELPSPLLGHATPAFRLPVLDRPGASFTPADLRGRPWMLTVWASWCVACADEQPALLQLAREGAVPIVGMAYKDRPQDSATWLARHGNPYAVTALDERGSAGIELGVYGVPESFIVDAQGIVRHRVVGPVTVQTLRRLLASLPLSR